MKVLQINKATPMQTSIITTADRFTEEESKHNGILDTAKLNQIKDIQTVVNVSKYASERGVSVGDIVLLDFKRYAKITQKKDSLKSTMDEHYNNIKGYEIPTILIKSKEHLLIDVGDISLIVNDYEYITEGEGFVTGEKKSSLILS